MEQRHITRDSLFVMAGLRLAGQDHRVKLRNISTNGSMAEGAVRVVIGTELEVEIRNIGWIKGTVAWVQDNRFGIAFATEIDAGMVRIPTAPQEADDVYARLPLAAARQAIATDPRRLRKL